MSQATTVLGEVLSRGTGLAVAYPVNDIEAAQLAGIIEVKVSFSPNNKQLTTNLFLCCWSMKQVETALLASEDNRSGILIIFCVTVLVALILGALVALVWRRRMFDASGSGVSLSQNIEISRHDEEKSNNIQNEENFRRLANPLKGSATSLSGAMELSMHPTPDVVSVISLGESSNAANKTQPVYPCDTDYDSKEPNQLKSNRGSQIMLYKAQNIDMRKNTVGSIESPHKDFGKRSINTNCRSLTPVLDSECLTVHV